MKITIQIRWILLGLLMLGVVLAPLVYAQETQPTRAVTADEVNTVARELWCPLCSGVRLDSCELKACEQMRQEIALKLAAGEDAAAIKAYFLTQYGPQILGEPPRAGFNWLAWILPFVALVAGALFLVVRARHLFVRGTPSPAPVPPPAPPSDRHAHQLEEELKRYG
jgi:cytochrome c-type biogenesis protein CcmH